MKEIRNEQGTEYKNEVLSKWLHIKHKRSTAYQSQSIAGCERNHRVLNEYIRIHVNEIRTDLNNWMKYYSICYNTTMLQQKLVSSTTTRPLKFYMHKKEICLNNPVISPIYYIDAYHQEVIYRLQLANKGWNEFMSRTKMRES